LEWIYHGEDESLMDVDDDSHDETSSHDDIGGLLFETFKDVTEGDEVHEWLNEDVSSDITWNVGKCLKLLTCVCRV
jgi:hypothetical protein